LAFVEASTAARTDRRISRRGRRRLSQGRDQGLNGRDRSTGARRLREHQSTLEVNMSSAGVSPDASAEKPSLGTIDLKARGHDLARVRRRPGEALLPGSRVAPGRRHRRQRALPGGSADASSLRLLDLVRKRRHHRRARIWAAHAACGRRHRCRARGARQPWRRSQRAVPPSMEDRFRAPTCRAARIRRTPRSPIRTATVGSFRRSRRAFRAGSGRTDGRDDCAEWSPPRGRRGSRL